MQAKDPNQPPLIALSEVTKDFPGTRALDRVSFDVQAGEIHSLVGENGAGKSTLIKVMSGVWPHGSFAGGIELDGKPAEFHSVREAAAAGISVIYQELALVPEMSVAENIFLGKELLKAGTIDYATMTSKARSLLKELNIDINPAERVCNLGVGHQQMVEIAKALSRDFKLLILDEPTAALSESEVEALLKLVKALRERGKGIIYISHRLKEVLELSDRNTVLRDGASVETIARADATEAILINRMVGRDLSQVFPNRDAVPGEVALELHDLTMDHPHLPGRKMLQGVSFSVRKGEVLGIAGLVGAGRTELLECLFGVSRAPWKGELKLHGEPVTIRNPRDAVNNRMVLVTEDRKGNGLVLDQPIRVNTSMVVLDRFTTAGWIHEAKESVAVNEKCRELRVKAPNTEVNPDALSGGNQQKVVLAKWMLANPDVLLLDEPTRGIDVGAKSEIYELIGQLTERGCAVVLVSSELEEVIGLSDRIITLSQGRLTGEFSAPSVTQETLMHAMTANDVE